MGIDFSSFVVRPITPSTCCYEEILMFTLDANKLIKWISKSEWLFAKASHRILSRIRKDVEKSGMQMTKGF